MILTTPTTRVPELPVPVDVVARPLGEGPPTYERMRSYAAYLERAPRNCAHLFVESDMLTLDRLTFNVDKEWDLALTYKSKGAWINSGMMLVRAGREVQAAAFFDEAARVFRERYLTAPKWGADQKALRDALRLERPPESYQVQAIGASRVLLIPRDEFTPFAPGGWSALAGHPTKFILHFSGTSKRAMPFFYWLHLGKGMVVRRPVLGALDGARRVRRWIRRAVSAG